MLIKKVYGGFRGKTAFADRFFLHIIPWEVLCMIKNGALIDINKSLKREISFYE